MTSVAIADTDGVVSLRPFNRVTDRSYCIRTMVMALKTEGWSPVGKVVETVVDDQSTRIEIACLTESPEVIVGYTVFRPGQVLYLTVRDKWRNLGVEKALFEATQVGD